MGINKNTMTEPKKYRTDWTIEPAENPYNTKGFEIQYYKGTPDMDNVHYCATVEEAEREIDDAIILEQEQVIERLATAHAQVLGACRASRDVLKKLGVESDLLNTTIEENQHIFKLVS